MSGYFGVRNWEEFQHYKDRDPTWIKLYNRLLDDYSFGLLPDSRKWHLIGIFLLASRHNNRVPRDPHWVSRKIGAQVPVDLGLLERAGFLVMLDSEPLADAEQFASPEKEKRREETEEDSMSADADRDDLFQGEGKKEGKGNYPASFEDFWHNYPTDPLMSKKKAYEQWKRLAVVDRVQALAACGPFREFCHLHPTYRPVHAQRFLSERRFDGFTGTPVPDPDAVAQAKDRADRLLRRGKYAPDFERGIS
ncbi:MAG TPA: hypothetical protein VJQ06_09335 [Rhizomicrobium sp.]|nr:hypothetical protein [Rhizomicrobium sp.]